MIPPYDDLMLPVLRLCAKQDWIMRDLSLRVADDLGLDAMARAQQLPSGQTVIGSRVQWAATYLVQAGLLARPRRGVVRITRRGQDVLAGPPPRIDSAYLLRFGEFKAFQARTKQEQGKAGASTPPLPQQPSTTPEEQIEAAASVVAQTLRDALLARVLEASPVFFERMILDLLLAMGYGGSRAEAGEHVGGTGDGGIDGVIREDRLGLDRTYLQAKRYQPGRAVDADTVRAFIGALLTKGAQKGVLITTSRFSEPACSAAGQAGGLRVVLIDGEELTRLLVQHGVGVRIARTVEVKRIDADYFEGTEAE